MKDERTARSTAEQTEKLIGTEILLEQDIEKIPEGTMPLPDGTVKLQQAEETAQLFGQVIIKMIAKMMVSANRATPLKKTICPVVMRAHSFLLDIILKKEETAQLFGQGATFKGGTEALNLFEKREE
mgnify:CR=1 FL=1